MCTWLCVYIICLYVSYASYVLCVYIYKCIIHVLLYMYYTIIYVYILYIYIYIYIYIYNYIYVCIYMCVCMCVSVCTSCIVYIYHIYICLCIMYYISILNNIRSYKSTFHVCSALIKILHHYYKPMHYSRFFPSCGASSTSSISALVFSW